MFDNIGGKIKMLAKITFWVSVIASVIGAIIIFASGIRRLILVGIIVLIVGPIVSYVLSIFVYGFGDLIENTNIITEKQTGIAYNLGKNTKQEVKEELPQI